MAPVIARRMRRAGLALGIAAVGACALPPRFGRIDGVLVDDRVASADEVASVVVMRDGQRVAGALEMALRRGDEIIVPDRTTVDLTFEAGYEVTLEAGTDLSILNPSIFVRVGKAIVKKVREVREVFEGHTEFLDFGAEGTEFVVEVQRTNAVRITVLDGSVTVRPKTGEWAPVTFRPFERGIILAPRGIAGTPLPPTTQRITRVQADSLIRAATIIRALAPTMRPTRTTGVGVTRTCTVPNVVGKTLDEARRLITAASLSVGDVQQLGSRVVTSQEPRAAVSVACSSQVKLFLGQLR